MDVVVERCAGLDVHRDNVVATVRVPSEDQHRYERQTRTFNATLAGLAALRAWLEGCAVTLVGMEATGVYWMTWVSSSRSSRWSPRNSSPARLTRAARAMAASGAS
jgi:transposase